MLLSGPRAIVILFISLLLLSASSVYSQEKLTFGTAIKLAPVYYLPILAAQEKGFWKAEGLDVEWVPFRGSTDMHRAIASGVMKLGMDLAVGQVRSVARGLPTMMVYYLQSEEGFSIWVSAASPIKTPAQLKGAALGVPVLGGSADAYGRAAIKALGLEKQLKFVGTGGQNPAMAALKTGAIQGLVNNIFPMLDLAVRGEVRELIGLSDYLPKPWMGHVVFSRSDFVKGSPATVLKTVSGVRAAVDFIKRDPDWSRQTMVKVSGYSPDAAKKAYSIFRFTSDGEIKPEALKNITNFLIEYGMLEKEKAPALEMFEKEKAPALESLYTNKFIK